MASTYCNLKKKGLIKKGPNFVETGIQYEVVMGSLAYGVSNDSSDMDIYGFCIPPRDYIFPHLRGEIAGFSTQGPQFEQLQQHHINSKSALGGKGRMYDITIYSIIKYFRLLMDNNPNIIDSLFVPRRCVLYSTQVGELVREKRRIFMHKGAWPKFKGYAYSQMNKMKTKAPEGKRKAVIEEHGYDIKFAYHIVRLLNEVEQILLEADLNLEQNKEQLKAIRRGEWSLEQVESYFHKKEAHLEELYINSKLPEIANEKKITELLMSCLEHHYGSLESCIVRPDEAISALRDIQNTMSKVNHLL